MDIWLQGPSLYVGLWAPPSPVGTWTTAPHPCVTYLWAWDPLHTLLASGSHCQGSTPCAPLTLNDWTLGQKAWSYPSAPDDGYRWGWPHIPLLDWVRKEVMVLMDSGLKPLVQPIASRTTEWLQVQGPKVSLCIWAWVPCCSLSASGTQEPKTGYMGDTTYSTQ